MIKTVRLDGRRAYFCNKNTGEIIYKYDENNKDLKLVINLDDSVLEINQDKIGRQYDGQIIVQHNDDRYIVDDGYNNTLVKAGYIVYDNYDEINIDASDPEQLKFGLSLREDIYHSILEALGDDNLIKDFKYIDLEYIGHQTVFKIKNDDDYTYTIIIDTVNNIVNRNQRRKENSLTYYPFAKNMDRYGTMYLSIFCQKNHHIENNTPRKKYIIPDNFIIKLIQKLNEKSKYHYVSCRVNRKVVYCRGM